MVSSRSAAQLLAPQLVHTQPDSCSLGRGPTAYRGHCQQCKPQGDSSVILPPPYLPQVAQTVLAEQVQALVAGTTTLEAFAAAATAAALSSAVDAAILPGVLLGAGDSDLDAIVDQAPEGSDNSKALAIGLGVGLGVGLPLLALSAWALLALWRSRSRNGGRRAFRGSIAQPMVQEAPAAL